MTYVITANCTRDFECIEACPVDRIHPHKDAEGAEEPQMLFINPDECIDCGACEPICPAGAIFTEDDLPEEWKGFTEINKQYYEDPAAAEAAVAAFRAGAYIRPLRGQPRRGLSRFSSRCAQHLHWQAQG